MRRRMMSSAAAASTQRSPMKKRRRGSFQVTKKIRNGVDLNVHLMHARKHSIPCAHVKRAIEWCRDSGQLLFSATRWERPKTS